MSALHDAEPASHASPASPASPASHASPIGYTTTQRGELESTPLTMASGGTLPGIDEEARRVVARATDRGELLRVAGSVAFQIRVSGRAGLPRPAPADIDLVVPARSERRIVAMLTDLGYTGEKEFNARHGDRRLIFWDEARDRKLEVFVGIFVMCHSLPLAERLDVDAETIPLAELLLTKLQIVELNEKDLCDMHSLLITHEVGSGDDEQINARRIAELCGADWGLHHTVDRTLDRLAEDPPSYTLPAEQRRVVDERVGMLRQALEDQPKTFAWRMRARVGERVRWYEEPEEI
jgi:hypothetical protein